jgi:hypothetical protein
MKSPRKRVDTLQQCREKYAFTSENVLYAYVGTLESTSAVTEDIEGGVNQLVRRFGRASEIS